MAVRYISQDRKDKVHIPGGFSLDWNKLSVKYPDAVNDCYLVALDMRKLAVLQKMVTLILPWYWLWSVDKSDAIARDSIINFKEELQECLMAGCKVSDLIQVQTDIKNELAAINTTIATKLDTIAGNSFDTSTVDDVEGILDSINTMLGGAALLATL